MVAYTSRGRSLAAAAQRPTVSHRVHSFTTLLSLLVVVTALALLAGRIKVPHPLLLVLAGPALALLPLPTRPTLRPELVFGLFLPPLLYQSAWLSSWHEFRARMRPIALMAVLLVLATIGAVACAAHVLLGLPWAVAFVLGAIVSPTDSVAPVSVVRRLGGFPATGDGAGGGEPAQ
ncbi:cation:proton antiporter [Cystobacter fuscus]